MAETTENINEIGAAAISDVPAIEDKDSALPKNVHDLVLISIGLILTFVTGYFLIFGIPRTWTGRLQIIGELKSSTSVRRRHSGSLDWQNITGKHNIYLKDVVYVPPNSSAVVKIAGKEVTIPADTMVQFDENSTDSFQVTLLELKAEPLTIALPQHRTKLSQLLEDIGPLEVRLSDIKSRTMKSIFEPPVLGRAFPMSANNFALNKISDFEIRLIEPATDRYNLRAYRWMKMAWTPVPVEEVQYTLEVSKDSRFRKMLPHKTRTNKLLVQFDDEATFFWRVRANKGDDEVLSESMSFSMVLRGGKTPSLPAIRGLGSYPGQKK